MKNREARQKALRHIFLALRESKSCQDLMNLELDEDLSADIIRCTYANGYQRTIVLNSASIIEMMRQIAVEV